MTRSRLVGCSCACILLALVATRPLWAAQATSAAPERLTVAGDVATPLSLAPDELKSLPRTRVEVKEDGRMLAYEGVLVAEILKRAGVPLARISRQCRRDVRGGERDGRLSGRLFDRRARPSHDEQRNHRRRHHRQQTTVCVSRSASDRRAQGCTRGSVDSHADAP